MKRIVAIGAHPDDVEIGCGGTLSRHVAEGYEVLILVMTQGGASGSTRIRHDEAIAGAKQIGAKIKIFDFPDTKCPEKYHEIFYAIYNELKEFKPDRGYIHTERDGHTDHIAVSQASIAALRNCPQILMYESPSTYPDFTVDYWYDISEYTEEKRSAILAHASEGKKGILSLDAIESLNRYRGYQCRKQAAEGFKIFRYFE